MTPEKKVELQRLVFLRLMGDQLLDKRASTDSPHYKLTNSSVAFLGHLISSPACSFEAFEKRKADGMIYSREATKEIGMKGGCSSLDLFQSLDHVHV